MSKLRGGAQFIADVLADNEPSVAERVVLEEGELAPGPTQRNLAPRGGVGIGSARTSGRYSAAMGRPSPTATFQR